MTFIDTNVLVYSVDGNSPDKQSVAKSIVAKAIQSPSFLVSAQVLNEFSNVSLLRLKLTPEETGRFVSVFRMIRSVALFAGRPGGTGKKVKDREIDVAPGFCTGPCASKAANHWQASAPRRAPVAPWCPP